MKARIEWTPEEDKILEENYSHLSTRELSKTLLPRRTLRAIYMRAIFLGLKKAYFYWKIPKHPLWTPEEYAILREHFASTRQDKLMVLLPRRTWTAIKDRAYRLGMKRHPDSFPPNYKRINFKLKAWQRGYVAGMLDGEGSISITNSKRVGQKQHKVQIAIANNHLGVLEKIRRWLGIGKIRKSRKVWLYEIIRTVEIYSLLKMLYPFLTIKQERAILTIQYCESRLNRGLRGRLANNEEELQIVKEFSKLTRGG